MREAIVLLLCLATVFVDTSESVDQGCSYEQEVLPGQRYYVYNIGYPWPYADRRSCEWYAFSEHRIRLTCDPFSFPWSPNCTNDRLTVQTSDNTTHRYCGDGTFIVESQGTDMKVTSYHFNGVSRFLCVLEAIEDTVNQGTEGNEGDSDGCRCGWKKPTRIVGGVDTDVNEYPLMAALVDLQIRMMICGATIISPYYVLTAAHCLKKDAADIGVLVGEHDITTGADTNATVLHRVDYTRMHPGYGAQSGNADDIGLVKTVESMQYNQNVGPACLPFDHKNDSFSGNIVTLLGWGTTSFGGKTSETLQKTEVSVIPGRECRQTYANATNKQLCTYAASKDACQLDSGGPVVWQNPTTKRLLLVGIISYGIGCGQNPGVNTRVGAYVEWIEETTKTNYCMVE